MIIDFSKFKIDWYDKGNNTYYAPLRSKHHVILGLSIYRNSQNNAIFDLYIDEILIKTHSCPKYLKKYAVYYLKNFVLNILMEHH